MILLLCALIALVVGVLVLQPFAGKSHALPPPEAVVLPPPATDQAAVLTFFQGDGAPLLAFLGKTSTLSKTPPTDGCEALAADLDTLGAPPVLANLAAGVPDPSVRDAAVNHVQAIVAYLGACHANKATDDAAVRVHFTATVLQRLLRQDGVQ